MSEVRELSEAISLLKSSYLFMDLPVALLDKVAERLIFDTFAPRETIFREGGPGDELFLIAEGTVEIRKQDPTSGIEFHLTKLDAPGAFGEIALLKAGPRTATALAMTETRLGILKGNDFRILAEKFPDFSLAVARSLATRVDELSRERRISYAHLSELNFDAQVLGMLPKATLMTLKAIPLAYNGTSLSVAMVNPDDYMIMESLRRAVRGVIIEPVVISEPDFERFMSGLYDKLIGKKATDKTRAFAGVDIVDLMHELDEDLEKLRAQEHDLVSYTRHLLIQAVHAKATELHLEPRADSVLVRHRLNGRLETVNTLPRNQQNELVARFKQLAEMPQVDTGLPQHGTIVIRDSGMEIGFMLDTLPTRYGERLVIRMPETNQIPPLSRLIPTSMEQNSLSRLLTTPYGLILVVGPSASGKTTTQYSMLTQLTERDLNAFVLGERMTYDLVGINRIETGKPGFGLREAMQAVLTQQPDVVLLEELGGLEACELAIDAALTGHLVISTFAAASLDMALLRFELMGGQRATMIDALSGVITQRLVRRLCPNCRVSYKPDVAIFQRLSLKEGDQLYRPGGCTLCGQTGYRGSTGVYEVVALNDQQRDGLKAGKRLHELLQADQRSLRTTGMELLRMGETTPQELLRELML
ncbi:MAG TPA: ATPase, T2SS/T4P/T4SS family [Candidatus Obscuribacterales bacterium]